MNVYGICDICKMELNSRDEKTAPPGICEGCFILEMNEDYGRHPDDYKHMTIRELWLREKDTTS